MAANQQNIGKDATLIIVGPSGPLKQLGLLTNFTARQLSKMVESFPINNNAIPVRRNTYQGWEGTFEYDRQDGTGDALADLLEANFYAGNADIHFDIASTIRNPDGTIDNITWHDCTLALDDAGSYQQDNKVTQRWKWTGAQRTN